MLQPTEEFKKLTEEVNQLSAEIASMKRKVNRMDGGAEKDKLLKEIKDKQFQVLFYIEKMNNIANSKQE
jgi:hypothetical protein